MSALLFLRNLEFRDDCAEPPQLVNNELGYIISTLLRTPENLLLSSLCRTGINFITSREGYKNTAITMAYIYNTIFCWLIERINMMLQEALKESESEQVAPESNGGYYQVHIVTSIPFCTLSKSELLLGDLRSNFSYERLLNICADYGLIDNDEHRENLCSAFYSENGIMSAIDRAKGTLFNQKRKLSHQLQELSGRFPELEVDDSTVTITHSQERLEYNLTRMIINTNLPVNSCELIVASTSPILKSLILPQEARNLKIPDVLSETILDEEIYQRIRASNIEFCRATPLKTAMYSP